MRCANGHSQAEMLWEGQKNLSMWSSATLIRAQFNRCPIDQAPVYAELSDITPLAVQPDERSKG
jgi:hypothetical protein